MSAHPGARSPALRPSILARRAAAARAELDDPVFTVIVIASLTVLTFALVRVTGGAPNAIMELGYLPVALAAYAFGVRGGAATGILVGAALGPVPALLGFDGTEGPAAWLIRATSFAGIGALIGRLLLRADAESRRIRERLVEYAQRERASLLTLARAAESREAEAAEHVRRLELTSARLAARAGLDAGDAAEIGWASMLHDVGKLRVPDRILLKPGPLDADEWTIVRLHPIWSEEALDGGEHLAVARQIARSHHENWDGSGYPDGLYGDRIPFAARVVRITDAFDAMTSGRPYQSPMSFEAALEELAAGAGRDFDPDLVWSFVELIRADPELRARLTDNRRA